jgi:hypothetical protein
MNISSYWRNARKWSGMFWTLWRVGSSIREEENIEFHTVVMQTYSGVFVVRMRSDDVGFNPSTRHYRRLIYYLYIHSYMFRSYDHYQAENWQRIRSFIRSHITVIVYIKLRIVDVLLLWATYTPKRKHRPWPYHLFVGRTCCQLGNKWS